MFVIVIKVTQIALLGYYIGRKTRVGWAHKYKKEPDCSGFNFSN
jgi:hypothetical protein